MSLNHNEYNIMNVIRNCYDKNIGCALFEFQLISVHSRTDVYEADEISASLAALTFSSGGVFLR